MKLTKKNYYTPKNRFLSNSKVSDYIRSPYYFYLKHIKHEIEFEKTPSMVIGSAVDTWLTEGKKKFDSQYTYSVLKKDDPEKFEENKTTKKEVLTKLNWEKVHQICETVESQSFFKEMKKHRSQVLLQVKEDNYGDWDGFAGILDWLYIDGEEAIITDLKTAQNIEKKKFFYHSLDYGYFRQMGAYKYLVYENFPEVKRIKCRIMAVENGPYPQKVALYDIPDEIIGMETDKLWESIFGIIAGRFERQNLSWTDSEVLKLT